MKLYKTTIHPQSNFSTTLKGDTLFGQMCWAVRYAFGNERLESLLSNYESDPFLVVSDAFAKGYLPKPSMPSRYLNEDPDKKKENRKKVWLTREDLQNGNYAEAKTDKEAGNVKKTASVVRNSINYKTSTTGGEGFDPYGEDETALSAQDIYFLVSDAFSLDELKEAFALLSNMGYGKDSSIGKGRFSIDAFTEVSNNESASTFMTLSPFVPNGLQCEKLFYEPFTRFGKSGADRANTNPFKKPILLADTAAVIQFDEKKDLHYVGQGVSNISSYRDIVHQGYAIVVPIKELSDGA
jgi:CRISPR-associated protein Csm4